MAFVGAHFVAKNPQKLLLGKTLGEAFATTVERLYGRNRREMSKLLGLDQRTVENVRAGKAGAAVITKALIARRTSHDDAWEMADEIIEQILGETRAEYEERKLRELREKTQNAISLHEERKARRAALAERAAVVDHKLARHASARNGDNARGSR